MIFKHLKYRQLLEFNVRAREIILLVIFFLLIFIEEVILKREREREREREIIQLFNLYLIIDYYLICIE